MPTLFLNRLCDITDPEVVSFLGKFNLLTKRWPNCADHHVLLRWQFLSPTRDISHSYTSKDLGALSVNSFRLSIYMYIDRNPFHLVMEVLQSWICHRLSKLKKLLRASDQGRQRWSSLSFPILQSVQTLLINFITPPHWTLAQLYRPFPV